LVFVPPVHVYKPDDPTYYAGVQQPAARVRLFCRTNYITFDKLPAERRRRYWEDVSDYIDEEEPDEETE
jgi:hypothetical protein